MKTAQTWHLDMGDMQILPGARHRPPLKRPIWIIVLVSMVSLFLVCAYVYPPQSSAACYVSSSGCKVLTHWLPPAPAKDYTDGEIASQIVVREILNAAYVPSKNAKIAFMFLSPGSLPFEKLWEKFFHVSPYMLRLICSLFLDRLCLFNCFGNISIRREIVQVGTNFQRVY